MICIIRNLFAQCKYKKWKPYKSLQKTKQKNPVPYVERTQDTAPKTNVKNLNKMTDRTNTVFIQTVFEI